MRTLTLTVLLPSVANPPTPNRTGAARTRRHALHSGGDQFLDQPVDLRRLLHLRHVSGIRHDVRADAGGQAFGMARGDYFVCVAPDDLHGNAPGLREPPTQDLLLSAIGEIGRRD